MRSRVKSLRDSTMPSPLDEQMQTSEQTSSNADGLAEVPVHEGITTPIPVRRNEGRHGRRGAAIGHRTPFPRSAESTVVFEDGSDVTQHLTRVASLTIAQLRLHRGHPPRQNHMSAMPRSVSCSIRCGRTDVVLPCLEPDPMRDPTLWRAQRLRPAIAVIPSSSACSAGASGAPSRPPSANVSHNARGRTPAHRSRACRPRAGGPHSDP